VRLLLVSIHGLIRGKNLELGRDPDTGGQTQYVVELARALADTNGVEGVDLVTRRVVDEHVSSDYAEQVEAIADKARIIRIEAGPEEYLAKEKLWDYLDTFADNLMVWLGRQSELPTLVHSHYADAGYVGVRVAHRLDIPLVHTGHSLGRDKRKRLLATGMSSTDIERRFNMDRRIDAEEEVLANADLVIASTDNEIEEQYGAYNFYQPERMTVIPPGTDLAQFHAPRSKAPKSHFDESLKPFLRKTSRPMILALSRPDERKNIRTLVKAYGESDRLREMANLVIVAGIREDIRDMEPGPRSVLTNLLVLIDYYNLYGHVAVPKWHRREDVPEIYRSAARSKGVFVNPALTEPFGLTLLEAAATGLPLVATENGGPVDIIENCRNGLLVDPLDASAMAEALLKILEDRKLWQKFSRAGLRNVPEHYSWEAHAHAYCDRIAELITDRQHSEPSKPTVALPRYRDRAIFTDIDQNLIGNRAGLSELVELLRTHRRRTVFGIATGRSRDSALSVMREYGILMPDVLITNLGTEIYYSQGLIEDEYWTEHIDYLWKPESIRRALADVDGLTPQGKENQGVFKISYNYDASIAPGVDEINARLRGRDLTAHVVHSFGQFLDILPARASKGEALRYIARGWDIPLDRVLVAGGSGADEDMMRGSTMAVVVANRHHEELSGLEEQDKIYFASGSHAQGIIEAIEHYQFFGDIKTQAA
jgi:sucrose-phosphate synthase